MTGSPDNSARQQPPRDATGVPAALRVLGDFELQREIGRGGMGTVYEALQRSLRRTVAIKVLAGHISSSPAAIIRFQREAQAAAKLHHPHIVPIFALGDEDGVYYYAMELIEGADLNEMILASCQDQEADTVTPDMAETVPLMRDDSGAIVPSPTSSGSSPATKSASKGSSFGVETSDEHFTLVAQHMATVADALDYAHREGVVHRDIKPHNLIMSTGGKVMISDFGLARLGDQPGVTVTGEMIGSPLYMSPEQLSGSPSPVDHRTDVYSLGATMYQWLTFKPLYPGETREQVISGILTSEPLPLSAHNSAIPSDLETICLKALERDRDRRYSSAGEMRDDLLRYCERRPIKARRASLVSRCQRFVRRHPIVSLATAAVLVAGVLSASLIKKEREVRTQEAATQVAEDDSALLLNLARQLPLESLLGLALKDAATPVFEGMVEAGQQAVATTDVDLAAVGAPQGIAQRAARDYYEATMPDGWRLGSASEGASASTHEWLSLGLWETDAAAALKQVTDYLANHAATFDALKYQAALFGRLNMRSEMLVAATQMVALKSDDATAYLWRALAHLVVGNADPAIADVDQATKLENASAWLTTFKGLAFALKSRDLDAVLAFERALVSAPDMIVGLFGRAYARGSLGDEAGAVDDLTTILEQSPDDVGALVVRGDYFVRMQDYEAGEKDYLAAMDMTGQNPAIAVRYLIARSKHSAPTLTPPTVVAPVPIPASIPTTLDTSRSQSHGGMTRDGVEAWGRRALSFATDLRHCERPVFGTSSRRSPKVRLPIR